MGWVGEGLTRGSLIRLSRLSILELLTLPKLQASLLRLPLEWASVKLLFVESLIGGVAMAGGHGLAKSAGVFRESCMLRMS